MAAPQFRANAMAHLSSPEQLDTLVRVTRPRSWIALGAVGLVLVVFVAWTLLGTVQTTFPGPGVLLTQYGTFNSVTPKTGQVTAVFVSSGDEVTKGQRLATLNTDAGKEITIPAVNSGRIEEMLAYPSDQLKAGAPIATIQPDDQKLHAFVYVPVDGRQPIKKGMPVQLSVTTVPSEQYGLLLGTVEKVGSFPVTRTGVNALLNNPDITSIVIAAGPVVQVEVKLTGSSSTPSGFAWTSGMGPPDPLAAGTLVNASVITAVQHPITLLFPSQRAPQ
ncbi:HlyD family efflux transporter periplasmic adaptor subunit [Rathayibacter soli]|uniref:HlyD family efflux transporter periplasmic adaptor subunit n=1 Tax=Rathayibacter soli TaxID=3144168 RepID=UPI0027E582FD|nr:HlyD family efflux transporter periplasmic adaptor subunit [Glaciibacter superstes]